MIFSGSVIATKGDKKERQLLTLEILHFFAGELNDPIDNAILYLEGIKAKYSSKYRNLSIEFTDEDSYYIFGERWETEEEFQERCKRDA